METPLSNTARLAARTVHLKLHPHPRTIEERREVLRVLERFGEVKMFRSLKYHPTTRNVKDAFLTIFNDPAVTQDLILKSPLRFRIISKSAHTTTEPTTAEGGEAGGGGRGGGGGGAGPEEEEAAVASTTSPSSPSHKPTELAEPNTTTPTRARHSTPPPLPRSTDVETRTFQLSISASSFEHARFLASPHSNPLGGPYTPANPKASTRAASLDRLVPPSLWAPALKDWETGGLRWSAGMGRSTAIRHHAARAAAPTPNAEPDTDGQHGKHVSSSSETPLRSTRRSTLKPRVMSGLQDLRAEWEKRQTQKLKPVG